MSTVPADDQPAASGVMVAQPVLDRIERLEPAQQHAVAVAIQSIGKVEGAPIRIDVPDGPPGAEYMALGSPDPDAPLVIYRRRAAGQMGFEYLVTALLEPDKYQQYKQAEREHLLDDPGFKTLVRGIEDGGAAYVAGRVLGDSGNISSGSGRQY